MTFSKSIFLVAALALTIVPLSFAQGTYTQIDYPGATMTSAQGVNNEGDIVGWYIDARDSVHGFILSGGAYTAIDYPGAETTLVYGINNVGQVVGAAAIAGPTFGFLYDIQAQAFSSFEYSNSTHTFPMAINDAGMIAGYFENIERGFGGFELVGSVFSTVRPPGAQLVMVGGISGSGDVVGDFLSKRNQHYANFLFDGTDYQKIAINLPGAFVYGINNKANEIVGFYDTSTGIVGFAYGPGTPLESLQFPNATYTAGYGVNDAGQVVGLFAGSDNVEHGFTWTPQPPAHKESKQ